MTQGDDMQEAYEMASDALGLSITSIEEAKEDIPEASSPDTIAVDAGSFLVVVEFDLMEYRRRNCSKAVKKTLSIPEWLNDAAVKQGVNFSQVLQEALIAKLNPAR